MSALRVTLLVLTLIFAIAAGHWLRKSQNVESAATATQSARPQQEPRKPNSAVGDRSNSSQKLRADHVEQPATEQSTSLTRQSASGPSAIYSEQSLQDRLVVMQERRSGVLFEPHAIAETMSQPVAWRVDNSVADHLQLTHDERHDGRAFVRFNPLKIETLLPGDTLDIPIQQRNAVYRMEVESVENHGDGSITWRGKLKDFDTENQVTITQSRGLTYAGINTPDDPYVMQVHGTVGWIARSGSLFKVPASHDNDFAGGVPARDDEPPMLP